MGAKCFESWLKVCDLSFCHRCCVNWNVDMVIGIKVVQVYHSNYSKAALYPSRIIYQNCTVGKSAFSYQTALYSKAPREKKNCIILNKLLAACTWTATKGLIASICWISVCMNKLSARRRRRKTNKASLSNKLSNGSRRQSNLFGAFSHCCLEQFLSN